MSQHLFDRPNSIEELTEQREYIGGIPEKVNENQVSSTTLVCDDNSWLPFMQQRDTVFTITQ